MDLACGAKTALLAIKAVVENFIASVIDIYDDSEGAKAREENPQDRYHSRHLDVRLHTV